MLIWINGPFGGGKTQTAHELVRRLPGSVLCDPEFIGFGLHRTMPPEQRGDFQDLPVWRQAVFEVLDRVLAEHPGPVVAPMTVVNPGYFDETVGRLRRQGHDVRHFALLARRETVLRRLRERGPGHVLARFSGSAGLRRESFAVANVDRCLAALRAPEFAQQLWTDEVGVPEVAERIAALAGLTLTSNTDSELRGRMRRAWVGVRHIRLR